MYIVPHMCNANNHGPNCRCGWGGEGHAGGSGNYYTPPKSWVERPITIHIPFSSRTYAGYTNPNAKCPVCGAAVFFYQSPYGGRVFFDELGPPWPKHPCTDNVLSKIYVESDTKLSSIVIEEPDRRGTIVPRWQREGWEAYRCVNIDQDYSEDVRRISGKLPSTDASLILYALASWYRLREEHMELMMIKCICKRAGRYLCEVAEVSESRVGSFRFTAYSKVGSWALGWPAEYSPVSPIPIDEHYSCVFWELAEVAKWFTNTVNLPLSPFVLLTGERVHNPVNYYEGLHLLLSRLPTSKVVLSGIRLVTELQSLRDYVQATCNGKD